MAARNWCFTLAVLLGATLPWCPPADAQAEVRAARASVSDRLLSQDGGFVLSRPFVDFYDSAFVLASPGGAAPQVVSIDALADALLPYDVILFGEIHGHPGVHLQQLRLLRALYERDAKLVLSFEQFERDVQGVVDDYLAGRVGERTLVDRGRAWEHYVASYRPLMVYARDHGMPVIAAEAPGWTISCIGEHGAAILDQFSPEERGWVARELHATAGPYRDKFQQFQSTSATHGAGGATGAEAERRAERSFTAQVARDDTMAESIVRARQAYPGRRVLHLTGSFHSEGFLGTAERLRLRSPNLRIAVIEPVEVDDIRAPSFAAERLGDGTALLLVYPTPADFAEGEDPSAWIRSVMGKRKASSCKYALPQLTHDPATATGSVPGPAGPAAGQR